MDIKEYYAEKLKHTKRLLTQLKDGKLPGQPKLTPVLDEFEEVDEEATKAGATLYITSVRNRDRNSTAGQVSLVFLANATRCITDGTHAVSTQEEITKFKAKQAANKKAADEADWDNAAVKQVVRERVVPEEVKELKATKA